MEIFSIIGLGVVAAMVAVTLRQTKPEFALLVSLAAGVFILWRVLQYITPVAAELEAIIAVTDMPGEYAGILFRALGMCFLTQVACDACRDAGESAIASKIEMAGRVCVLAISLPLFTQVLTIVRTLMQ